MSTEMEKMKEFLEQKKKNNKIKEVKHTKSNFISSGGTFENKKKGRPLSK